MKIIPHGPSLVVLVGPSGGGKSTFVSEHFEDREVVSSDAIRVELTGDMRRQDKNDVVFAEMHRRIAVKIAAGQRVVADATHLRDKDRKETAEIGLMLNVPVTYVVIDRPLEAKLQTGGWRLDVRMKKGLGLIETHHQTFQANEKKILSGDQGSFAYKVGVVDTRVDEFRVEQPLPRGGHAPTIALMERGFKHVRVVGDVHGNGPGFTAALKAREDTFFLFLGDLLDYDPHGLHVVERVLDMVRRGKAISLRGNHEKKIANIVTKERTPEGFRGRISHGNDATINVLKAMRASKRAQWEADFLSLVEMSPDWIEMGRWMFVHGAAHPSIWGNTIFRAHRESKAEVMAMFGETTGEFKDGFPVRIYDWVDTVPARHHVVVGHAILSTEAPVEKVGELGGRATFLDTGSSKEGHLSWMDFEVHETDLRFLDFGRE